MRDFIIVTKLIGIVFYFLGILNLAICLASATILPWESHISSSSPKNPVVTKSVLPLINTGPGAGLALKWTVSSIEGTQPLDPNLLNTGGDIVSRKKTKLNKSICSPPGPEESK